MSEEADALMDAEMNAWDMHVFGECGDHCAYCYVEEAQKKRRIAEMDDLGDEE